MFPGLKAVLKEYNVSCTKKQYGAPRETQTNGPFISSQALYHWLTLQVLYSCLVTVSPGGTRFSGIFFKANGDRNQLWE